MCGRFGQYNISFDLLQETFRIVNEQHVESSYNVAPTDKALTVGENPETADRTAQYLRWGLIPFWSDGPDNFDSDLINARVETAHEKPAFRKQFHERRCIVPIDGFYEWKPTNGSKQPYWIHPATDELFGLAGLWDTWSDGDDGSLQSFTILTREANDKIGELHDRMPVILDPETYDDWLDITITETDEILSIVNEFPSEKIDFHPVSKAVNNPSYDEEECVQPV